jgi:CMP/dCMP kinase
LKKQGREVTESYDQILADVIERDRKDSQRKVAPLKVAEGAIEVDTSDMEKEDVLQYLIEIACNKAREYHLEL